MATIINWPCDALKAKTLKATAKAIAKDAIGLAIKSQVSNEIGLDALAHDAQSRRAPDQLPLTFGKAVAPAKVVSHALDKIAEPARRLATAVQAIDAKQTRSVADGAPMRALAASYISAISIVHLPVFHTPALPHKARHTQVECVIY